MQFLWTSYAVCCCLCAIRALHSFIGEFCKKSLKMWSAPRVGTIILKAAPMKNHEKVPSSNPPMWAEKCHFGAAYRTCKFTKSTTKMRICFLWHILGVNFVCHLLFYLCLYCSTQPFFPNFAYCLEDVLPALGGKHNFENRTTAFCIKKPTFGTPQPRG